MNRKNSGSERRMGIVAAVHPGELIVKIQQLSACTGCHAKDFCTTADCKDRLLAIQTHQAERYEVGQAVIVEGKNSIGRRAILLAFVTPLLLLLLALGIGQEILCWSETSSILLALATSLRLLSWTQTHPSTRGTPPQSLRYISTLIILWVSR